MNERDNQDAILKASSEMGARLFRNNVGKGYVGKLIFKGRDVLIKGFRVLHAGLCQGSSDLIGWDTILITPEMVGKKIAVFKAVEVKARNGLPTKEQVNFINQVNKAGGIGIIANSEKKYITEYGLWITKLKS